MAIKRYVANISIYIYVEGEENHDQKAINKAKKFAEKIDKKYSSTAAKCENIFESPFGSMNLRQLKI